MNVTAHKRLAAILFSYILLFSAPFLLPEMRFWQLLLMAGLLIGVNSVFLFFGRRKESRRRAVAILALVLAAVCVALLYGWSFSKNRIEKYQALADVLKYAKDEEKTEREFYVDGINCNPSTARDQFVTVKEQFDKEDGIQAYHGYLSFEETDITPELAQQVGMAFAERMWGDRFQVLVTTHLNTEHLHCHFVVNSVSFKDGKRLQNKEKAWWYFRHIADEVCLEHGLSVVQNPEAYQSPRILTQKDKAGMPTRYNLARAALNEAIAMSHNLRQLVF